MKKFSLNVKTLESTIEYIHDRNPYNFTRAEIYKSIMDTIVSEYDNPSVSWSGTMGYIVKFDDDECDEVRCSLYVLPTFYQESSLEIVGDRENTTVEFRV